MGLFDERAASPMLIAQQMEAFDDPEWIYELKLDGFRCLAYVEPGKVDFRNKRNLNMLSRFPELDAISQNVRERCILDGEVVILKNGVPDYYTLQRRTLLTDRFKIEMEAARHPASYVTFDCLYEGERELTWNSLLHRKQRLLKLITENERIAVSRFVEGTGIALYHAAEVRKLEGVVAKRKDSIYMMGKRTRDWVKFKRMADEDFVVAGYIQKSAYIFSLVLAKYQQGLLVYKGHVTSGVTRDVIGELTAAGEQPFRLMPAGNEGAIWVCPDHVCVVEYMPNTKNTLRQPVFKGYRDDVLPEDVQI